MAFAHRDLAFDQNFIGIMDDPVHDCLRDWIFNIGIRIDPVVPLVRFILCTKDNRAFFASGFYNLEEIIRFLGRKCPDQPFIKNEKFDFLVGLYRLF